MDELNFEQSFILEYDAKFTKRKIKSVLQKHSVEGFIQRVPRPNSEEYNTIITVYGLIANLSKVDDELRKSLKLWGISASRLYVKPSPTSSPVFNGVVICDTVQKHKREDSSGAGNPDGYVETLSESSDSISSSVYNYAIDLFKATQGAPATSIVETLAHNRVATIVGAAKGTISVTFKTQNGSYLLTVDELTTTEHLLTKCSEYYHSKVTVLYIERNGVIFKNPFTSPTTLVDNDTLIPLNEVIVALPVTQSAQIDTITLRKVGQKSRGYLVVIPKTLEKLIEKASELVKLPVVEIWDENELTLTDIVTVISGKVYYAATQENVDS